MSSLHNGGHSPELCPGSETKSLVLGGSHTGDLRISYLTNLKPTNSLLSIRTIWKIVVWSLKKTTNALIFLVPLNIRFFKLCWGIKFFVCICVALWEDTSLELYAEASVPYLSLALGISDEAMLNSFCGHKNHQKTAGLAVGRQFGSLSKLTFVFSFFSGFVRYILHI